MVQVYSDNGRKESSCDARLKSRLHLVALLLEVCTCTCVYVLVHICLYVCVRTYVCVATINTCYNDPNILVQEMPKVCADVFCVPELRQLLIQLLQLVSKDANTFICPL